MASEKLQYILELSGLNKFQKGMKSAEKTTKQTSSLMTKAFKGIGAAAIAYFSIQTVRAVGRAVFSLAEMADQSRVVGTSMKRLAQGIGQNSNEILRAMQRGVGGAVGELQLMKQANQAILLGIPVTAASMEKLTQGAARLGTAVGRTASESVADLITGIGRMSPLILDNLGITINMEEAMRGLGDGASDAEKKMAFYNAVMAKVSERSKTLGDQTPTLTDNIGKLDAAWEDFSTTLGNVFLPAATAALGITSNLITALDRGISVDRVGTDLGKLAGRLRAGGEGRAAGDLEEVQKMRGLQSRSSELGIQGRKQRQGMFFDQGLDIRNLTEAEIELEKIRKEEIQTLNALDTAIESKDTKSIEGLNNQIMKFDEQREKLREYIETMKELEQVEAGLFIARAEAESGTLNTITVSAKRVDEMERRLENIKVDFEDIDIVPKQREGLEETERLYEEFKENRRKDLKDLEYAARDRMITIPRTLEDEFASSLSNIQGLLSSLNVPSGGIIGNISRAASGIRSLHSAGAAGFVGIGNKLSGSLEKISGFTKNLPAYGQVISAALPAMKSIFGGISSLFSSHKVQLEDIARRMGTTHSEEETRLEDQRISDAREKVSDYQQTIDLIDAQLQGLESSDYKTGLQNTRAATVFHQGRARDELQDVIDEVNGVREGTNGQFSGSQAFTSVATITEATANEMVGVLETQRIQDAERNDILRDILVSNQNIETLTALGSRDFMGFQGIA